MKPTCRQTARLLETPLHELTPEIRAHMQDCDICQTEYCSLQNIAQIVKTGGVPTWDTKRKKSVRDAVVVSAANVPVHARRPWGYVTAAAAILLMLAAVFVFTRSQAPPAAAAQEVQRGTVHASPGARFARLGSSSDEIVRLYEGHITVEVQKLHPGERFRVITGDGEVEVRGTAFEVIAENDVIQRVRVLHGRVDVRPTGRSSVQLGPNERWTARAEMRPTEMVEPQIEPVVPTLSSQAAHETKSLTAQPQKEKTAPPKNTGETAPTDAELMYQKGWGAMRVSDFSRAASAFEQVAAEPHSALAQDAAYWRAVALGRAGRKREAASALESFIEKFPASFKTSEAQAMLGWIRLEQGDRRGARAAFEAAEKSDAPNARKSAVRGLEKLNVSEE